MHLFATTFCIGLDRALMEFLTTADAQRLCLAIQEYCPMTASRFQTAMYQVCFASSWDYPRLGAFFLHRNIELHFSSMMHIPDHCPNWHFHNVKVNMFGCHVNLQGVYKFIQALPSWNVHCLDIGSDFSLPHYWPRNISILHIRFCPRMLHFMVCPDTVRELVVYCYAHSNLKIISIPIFLDVLDIDDHCIGWPRGLQACSVVFLRLRLWAHHTINMLPNGIQNLVLVIKQKCNVQIILDLVANSQLRRLTIYSFVSLPPLSLVCPSSMSHCSVYFKIDNCLFLQANLAQVHLSEKVCVHIV